MAVLKNLGESHGSKTLPNPESEYKAIGEFFLAYRIAVGLDGTLTEDIDSSTSRSSAAGHKQSPRPAFVFLGDFLNLPRMKGGPLLNEEGELIGLTGGSLSALSGKQELDPSIPISFIETVLPTLSTVHQFVYPFLGVAGGQLAIENAREQQLFQSSQRGIHCCCQSGQFGRCRWPDGGRCDNGVAWRPHSGLRGHGCPNATWLSTRRFPQFDYIAKRSC